MTVPGLSYLGFFVVTLLLSITGFANSVSIGDASFEGNELNAGEWSYDLSPEWTGTEGTFSYRAFEEYVEGFSAPDGTDYLGMEQDYAVWQDLGVSFQANTLYTLTVAAGNRGEPYTVSGNQSQYLLADSTGAVHATGSWDAFTQVPVGAFADAPPLTLNTATNPDAVGKTIRILLRAGGSGRSHFDLIRLDAIPLSPPGTATVTELSATSVTASSATILGNVTAIGDSAPALTLFWGPANAGPFPANWPYHLDLPGTSNGAFSATIEGLSPASNWFFTVMATNSAGQSWAAEVDSFETLALLPTIENSPATEISPITAKVGAVVTTTGGDAPVVTVFYGTTDGGSDAAAWAASANLGTANGAVGTTLTGLSANTTWYFRARAQNSAGSTWTASTASFRTLEIRFPVVENLPAQGVTGTTASLAGRITDDGGTPTEVTFFYGPTDGGTNPASWAYASAIGQQSGDFSQFIRGLSPSTTWYFRARASNPGGTAWASSSATFTTTTLLPRTAVIHEIHYHPADDPLLGPLPLEFIELHNPGDTNLNLAGATLSSAVDFTFPAGTTLAPGAFLVVAADPAVFSSKFGFTPLGPWSGKLSNDGETILLKNSDGTEQDRVSFGPGFPWPTAANGAGASLELIHPSLDNDLAGSWRSGSEATETATLISASSSGWKYKKGSAEASSPVDDWRAVAFSDAAWLDGITPVGYGTTVACATTPSNMKRNYSTVYARKSFTVSASSIPDTLMLKVRSDDGCIVWINGTEVARLRMPAGQVAFSQLASSSVTTATWETISLTNTSTYLLGGTNVITIQAANITKSDSDFNFDAALEIPATPASTTPTPGRANSAYRASTAIPPQIRQVSHSPNQPSAGQAVTVTAKITDPEGVSLSMLSYQPVDPGNYIRRQDAAYMTTWTDIAMHDDGLNGDATAGDSIFSAVLPGSLQTHRRLMRYKIRFADAAGNSQTVPYADDEQPNFAYFTYNGVPAWSGTMRAGGPVATFPAEVISALPPYQLIAQAADVQASQYDGNYNGVKFQGCLIYDGVVYDHIQFKNRGNYSNYVAGKNKWNLFFNRSRDLVARDNRGRKYDESWNNLILNANASPWVPLNRGSAGIEEAASTRILELAGNTAFRTHYVHWRVIDGATESSASNPSDGDLWGLYLAIEPNEGNLLKERNLPDGNIYAIEASAGNKKHQAENQAVNSSDWDSFRNNLAVSGQSEAWYRENIDIPKLLTFLAINRLIGNVDLRLGDNYRAYHRSSDQKWELLGYDFDMQFIPATHWGGEMDGVIVGGQPLAMLAVMRHPAIAREFRNRCRELLDLLASDASANGGQIGQLFHETASFIHPTGQSATWAYLDATLWNEHPYTAANHRDAFFKTPMYGSFGGAGGTISSTWLRTLPDPDGDGFSDFPSRLQWFIDYATDTYPATATPWRRKATTTAGSGTDPDPDRQKGYGYQYLQWESLYGGYADCNQEPTIAPHEDFPATPSLTAVDGTFPAGNLAFRSSSFSDPQGAQTFAAWQWRLAEISAPGLAGYTAGTPWKYEIEDDYTSEELTTTPDAFKLPAGLATPGKTWRVRVRHKDTTGNWSHWSAAVQFSPTSSLLHYWNFNADTDAARLIPNQSIGGGVITPSLTGTAVLTSDTGEKFAAANARNGDIAGRHLRINYPLNAALKFFLPTTGHTQAVVRYETRRSGKGAGIQAVSYSIDGETFLPLQEIVIADEAPVVQTLDFTSLPETANNPLFAVRIDFRQGSGGIEGNNRIDNLTLEANPISVLPTTFADWQLLHFTSPSDRSDPAISGPNACPTGDSSPNLLRYALGLGPYDAIADHLPKLSQDANSLRFLFRADPSLSDVTWRVESSTDLQHWSSVPFDSTTTPLPPPENGWFPITLPAPSDLSPNLFTRLIVSLKW